VLVKFEIKIANIVYIATHTYLWLFTPWYELWIEISGDILV